MGGSLEAVTLLLFMGRWSKFNGIDKECNGCKLIKPLSEFATEKRALNGYKPRCKDCYNEDYRKRYPNFKDNKANSSKARYHSNRELLLKKSNDYYRKTKVQRAEYNKIYNERNKERIRQKNIEYRIKNKAKLTEKRKVYVSENKEKVRQTNKKSWKKKFHSDMQFRLKQNMRCLLRSFVRDKGQRTSHILGYTHIELMNHLGRYPNMGEQLDHKIPISWFSDMRDVKIINDMRNLQILTAYKNQRKNNKYAHPVPVEYYELILPYIKNEYLSEIKHHGN